MQTNLELVYQNMDRVNHEAIYGRVVKDDAGLPALQLECGCNEFWLTAEEIPALIAYLVKKMPELSRGGEDG